MLIGEGGMPNVILLLAGLVLVAAGVVAIIKREDVADFLRELRDRFLGEPRGGRSKNPGTPWIPILGGAVLIAFGLIGAYGGLFAELPPPGAPRV